MSVRLAGPPACGASEPLDAQLLRARAQALLGALDREDAELSIRLADDAAIAELNLRYRGRQDPTDVLSFSLLEGDHADYRGPLLGDVVIGVGVAARQAVDAGCSLDEEVLRLLIHGVLHLLGYDHEEAGPARRMRAEERRLRQVIGT